jgi:hypothetical protein
MGAPYVSPEVLLNASTPVDWDSFPVFDPEPGRQRAEVMNLCRRASDALDEYLQSSLRATINTETVMGPGDPRAQLRKDGTWRLSMSRPPVVAVLSGTVSPTASFGSTVNPIPANLMMPEKPVMGIYGSNALGPVGEVGQAVLVASGFGSWGWGGRGGCRFTITYLNGYPHASLTEPASATDVTIHVDDITGMVGKFTGSGDSGAFCTFYPVDGSKQESASVLSADPDVAGALSGPGTLTLTAPLASSHARGELFTTLPSNVQQAAILMASSLALLKGATTVAIATGATGGPAMTPAELSDQAKAMVHSYRRSA